MIYCAQCGTQNKDENKFCSHCGARLAPPAGLICPMCSTPNPVDTVFCNNCGARVVPLIAGVDRPAAPPPIKGLSLPTKTAAPPTPAPREDSENWLANLRAATPTDNEAESETKWARDENADAEIASDSATTREDDPAWMRDLRRAASDAPADEANQRDDFDQPRETRARSDQETARAESEADEPSWIKRLRESAQAPEPALDRDDRAIKMERAETRDDIVDQDALPDWLQAETPPEKITPEPELADARAQNIAPLRAEETSAPRAAEPETRAGEMPDWMRMAMPAEKKDEPRLEPIAPEEIPSWVARLKPTDAPPIISGESEAAGPLAGLRSLLPLANAIAQPHAPAKPAPTPNGKTGAQLFQAILAAPASTEITAPEMKRRAPAMQPILYLLIALAVIIPFFLPTNLASSGLRLSGTPAAEFYDAIQTLPANANILLAFDYDASVAGEMDLLARAVTRQLMQRRANIIAVSTLDTGPALAQRILEPAARENNYRYGANYLNAGYLAGNEAGLAQIASIGLPTNARDYLQNQLVRQIQIATNIKSPRDFALVVVLAGTDDALKLWLEQVQARANLRVAAATSAGVEPKARAYRDAKQIVGLVSGLIGAAQYEVLTGQPGQAVVRVNAQSAAQIVLVLAIVIGNFAWLISRVGKKI